MINVFNSYRNYVTTFTFTSSHITNHVCLVHIQCIIDIRIGMVIDNKYKFRDILVHFVHIK